MITRTLLFIVLLLGSSSLLFAGSNSPKYGDLMGEWKTQNGESIKIILQKGMEPRIFVGGKSFPYNEFKLSEFPNIGIGVLSEDEKSNLHIISLLYGEIEGKEVLHGFYKISEMIDENLGAYREKDVYRLITLYKIKTTKSISPKKNCESLLSICLESCKADNCISKCNVDYVRCRQK